MKVRDIGGTMGSSVGNNSHTYSSTGNGGSGLMDNALGSGSLVGANKGGKHVLPKKSKQGYSKTQQRICVGWSLLVLFIFVYK